MWTHQGVDTTGHGYIRPWTYPVVDTSDLGHIQLWTHQVLDTAVLRLDEDNIREYGGDTKAPCNFGLRALSLNRATDHPNCHNIFWI